MCNGGMGMQILGLIDIGYAHCLSVEVILINPFKISFSVVKYVVTTVSHFSALM